jgi:hypothetical protein
MIAIPETANRVIPSVIGSAVLCQLAGRFAFGLPAAIGTLVGVISAIAMQVIFELAELILGPFSANLDTLGAIGISGGPLLTSRAFSAVGIEFTGVQVCVLAIASIAGAFFGNTVAEKLKEDE